MCECGCGELHPIAKIRGDGGWHFLEVYPGCTNGCGTSWGLGSTWIADDDDMLDEWLLNRTPTVEYSKYGQWGVPILDTGKLYELFGKEAGDEESVEELRDFVERGGLIRTHDKSVPQQSPVQGEQQ